MDNMRPDGPITTIRGLTHPPSYFQIVESKGIDWRRWIDVLCGKIAGAMFREALDPALCQQIRENFWSSPALKRQSDGLPAHARGFVGASIGKSPLESYLNEAEKIRPNLDALFAHTNNFYGHVIESISEHLAQQGYSLRVAEHNGRQAAKYKMRSWVNTGEFVIAPHDDFGILKAPHLRKFEVAQVDRVIGIVICVENGEGGELHYWNICPNDETREALGFKSAASGYDSFGYPLAALADFDKITLTIRAGDLYLFEVANVHAVGYKTDDEANRTTLVWSMGFRDSATVLHWA